MSSFNSFGKRSFGSVQWAGLLAALVGLGLVGFVLFTLVKIGAYGLAVLPAIAIFVLVLAAFRIVRLR